MIKTWIIPLALLVMTSPAMALQSASASNGELMKEVRAVRSEIKDLKQTIEQMQTLLNAMAAQQLEDGKSNAILIRDDTSCEVRIAKLEQRLDNLKGLGYTADHPDVKSMSTRVQNLRSDCDAAE